MLQIALTAHIFEGYESTLIGFMALEIGRRFFPTASDKTAVLLSFAVFASSFLARPAGSVFFGIWAARRGTAAALRLSLILVALPAALITFLPTYATAGYVATGLLVVLKMTQGFAEGGDAPLCGYFVALNTPPDKRGLYCGLAACSSFIGWLFASFVVWILPDIADWALRHRVFAGGSIRLPDCLTQSWRWPFLLCVPLSGWVFSVRSSLFNAIPQRPRTKCDRRALSYVPLLQVVALIAITTTQLFILFIWLPSYLGVYLGVGHAVAYAGNVVALIVFSVVMVGVGYGTRWIAPEKYVLFGIAGLVLCSYPLFTAMQGAGFAGLLAVQLIFALFAGCLFGAVFIVMPELLKDNWQELGITIAYTLPVVVLGGTAPLVSTYLIRTTRLLAAPALYIVAMGMLALPVAYWLAFRRGERGRRLPYPA
jgi:MHS family proline/betaine transporter-like MFS transporter